MSGKANAVLWLGIILIVLNLVSRWDELKSVIFGGGSSSSGGGGGGGGGGINLNPFPFLPHVTIPGIHVTIPLSQTQPNSQVTLWRKASRNPVTISSRQRRSS